MISKEEFINAGISPQEAEAMEKGLEVNKYLNDHFISPIEKRNKMALKKGSTQLPGCIWDFIDNRAVAGVISSASIIRGYVVHGVRVSIVDEIKRMKDPFYLKKVREGMVREFRRYMAEKSVNFDPTSGTATMENYVKREEIFAKASLNEVIDFYLNNPKEFEAQKNNLINAFAFEIPDDVLIEILSGGDY